MSDERDIQRHDSDPAWAEPEPVYAAAAAPAPVAADPALEVPVTEPAHAEPPEPPPPDPGGGGPGGGDDERPPRPKVHRIRLALIMLGLSLIAFVSTIFGIMMAVASDLPKLENRAEYKHARNSVLLDVHNRPLGILTGKENRFLVGADQISPAMQHAIIAIEDKRFYEHGGVDYRGIGRALFQDILSKSAVQGASTIPQQFVKNALAAQQQRTVLQKLREAALAYHLTRKWSKQKILTEYLNTVYFGNGAYGVESAARVYWSFNHPGCGEQGQPVCVQMLTPSEAALLAGVVASPSRFDPIAHPVAAKRRRDEVLTQMVDQGSLSKTERDTSSSQPLPTRVDLTLPSETSKAPYFTTWIKQQVVDRFGAQRAFGGGLKIKTTLDLDLQAAAEESVQSRLSNPSGPHAALVAIDNKSGEVRAMVGGEDYSKSPFNLATQGQRQPGSSFKGFVLAAALKSGISPGSVWSSQQKKFVVPHSRGKEFFVVNNYEGNYSGSNTLAGATTVSDNSIYAEVGIKTGIGKIAALARQMGIRTPVSRNPAITLGGLKQGVTPLDMAHAYEVFPRHGERVSGTLGAADEGPVGIRQVTLGGGHVVRNKRVERRVLSKNVADTATGILRTVVTSGTGKAAQVGEFAAGKTGTTENYGDAWFVGFTERYTVAVWVGYPDSIKSMKTDYNGGPVAGGTFPAEIWQQFVSQAIQIDTQRAAERAAKQGKPAPVVPTTGPAPIAPTGPATTGQQGATGGAGTPGNGQGPANPPANGNPGAGNAPKPTPAPAPKPTPAPAPPPSGGGGGVSPGGQAAPTG